MSKFDIVGLGELLIDFTYHSKSESNRVLFEHNPGGAVPNVLSAATKMGKKTCFIGKVGDDMHGNYLKSVLDRIGIDTKGLIIDKDYFTTLAFVNLASNGERSFSFARKPGADIMLKSTEVDIETVKNAKIFHFGSLSLTDEPARSATFEAIKAAKKNGVIISYDPNYRKPLWKDKEIAKRGMRLVLSEVDIIKISDEETELICDEKDIEKASKALLDKGIAIVIITLGENGAYVATKEFSVYTKCDKTVKVVDTTGAGDCFMGNFLNKFLESNKKLAELTKEDIEQFANYANACASICITKRGALESMPTKEEVISFLR